jgi:hypothetical protein
MKKTPAMFGNTAWDLFVRDAHSYTHRRAICLGVRGVTEKRRALATLGLTLFYICIK